MIPAPRRAPAVPFAMPFFPRRLLPLLGALAAACLASPRAGAETFTIFSGTAGLAEHWTVQTWGGLESKIDRAVKRETAGVSFLVRPTADAQPYAGFAFGCPAQSAFPLDPGWRERGQVILQLRPGADFDGAPLRSITLKVGLAFLLPDGKVLRPRPDAQFTIEPADSQGFVPVRLPIKDELARIPADTASARLLSVLIQHEELPAGAFHVADCALVHDQPPPAPSRDSFK